MFDALRNRTSLRSVIAYVASGLAVIIFVAAAALAGQQPVQAQPADQAPPAGPAQPTGQAQPAAKPEEPGPANHETPKPAGGGSMYLSPERLSELEQQGYNRTDIYTALSLSEKTGIALETWLAARKQGRDWPDIVNDLAKGKPLPRDRFSEDGRNLTEAEIRVFMDAGVSSADISTVGDIVYRYGGDPNQLMQQHKAGKDWAAIDHEAGARWRQQQEEKAHNHTGFGLGAGGKAEATSSGAQCPVPTLAGLTTDVVNEMLSDGLTAEEIRAADWRAFVLGIDLKQVAADRQKGEKLMAAVERADSKRSGAERAAAFKRPLPNEENRVKFFAKETGKSEEEVRKLREQRRSWVDIAGKKSPDGLPNQYDIADSWGITDHILVERATDMGLSVFDVRQALHIAEALGLPVEEVIVLKTPSNTWSDVITALAPVQP